MGFMMIYGYALSKLPMRQKTRKAVSDADAILSKLPMRQKTAKAAALFSLNYF